MSILEGSMYSGQHFYLEIEGDEIAYYDRKTDAEQGRINMITGKSINWYSATLCKNIIAKLKEKRESVVCVLGGAVGAIPYELMTFLPRVNVVTVDIDPESIEVLKYVTLHKFGSRSTVVAQDAQLFVKQCGADMFDCIVVDIFDGQSMPSFIFAPAFIKACLLAIKVGGFLLTNIIAAGGDNQYGDVLHSLGINYKRTEKLFSNGQANILYEVKK